MKKIHYLFVILICLLTILFVEINLKLYSVLLITFFISLIFLLIFDRRYFFFFIISLLFFLPQMDRYSLLPIFSRQIAVVFLIIMLLSLITRVILKSSYNYLWIVLTIYIIVQITRGIMFNYNSTFIFDESIKYLYYPIGFYFTYSVYNKNNTKKNVDNLLFFFLTLGFVISIQIIFYYFFYTKGQRVLTRQANLLLISIITSLSFIVLKKKLNYFKKFILVLLISFYLIGILLFMQRSLWIATIVSILLFILIMIFKTKFQLSKILTLSLIILIMFITIAYVYNNMKVNSEILESRTSEIESKGLATFSIAARIISYYQIFQKMKNNWIFGLGIGDSIKTSYLNMSDINIVDNSYIVIIWKFGLVGFSLFFLIYLNNIRQLIYLIKYSKGNYQILSLIFLVNIFGQFVNGLACVILILYHFNFIWAAQIAITDIMYRQKKMEYSL